MTFPMCSVGSPAVSVATRSRKLPPSENPTRYIRLPGNSACRLRIAPITSGRRQE